MVSPKDLVFAPLAKWLNDCSTDTSDDALKEPHVLFILHGLIIQQPLMKMSFYDFFSPKSSILQLEGGSSLSLYFKRKYLSRIGHLCLFILAMWKRKNKEETGDVDSWCSAYCEDHGNPSSSL